MKKNTPLSRRSVLAGAGAAAALGSLPAPALRAQVLDKFSYLTNWRAQAEHGGFYQAVATGIYRKYGIECDLQMGGPQQNPSTMLLGGRVDAIMSNSLEGLNYAKENLPFLVIASIFQKDPQVLIAHPGMGNDTIAQMKGKPIMISGAGRTSYWPFLRVKFGFTDDQIRPYTFNMGPFLADKNAIQQGFLSSEPFAIEQAGVKPAVSLIADAGFENYQTTINISRRLVTEKADLVQRFINASIEGWYSYIYGDPAPANVLIKKDNPEMDDVKIAYAIKAMKDYGIVDSGDSKQLGIGAMTDARWERLYNIMAEAGVYPRGMNFKNAYSLQFINKRVGMG